MAIPVARVHLKVAHASLPALLPTPPRWKMLPQLLTVPPCVAAILPKPIAKPGRRADSDERWDAHKAKQRPGSSSASSGRRSPLMATIRSGAASSSESSEPCKNARTMSPPLLKPGRADAVERWDAHKKATSPAASSSSSSSGTSSLASSSKQWPIEKHRHTQPQAELIDDGESSSTGSYDMEEEEDEEIVWKPRAMYAGPGFVVAVLESSMIPMPTSSFLLPVA